MLQTKMLKVAIVVGESSGDILGADLIQAFLEKFPNAEFKGIAGPAMKELGCESLYLMDELSVIGIWAILKRLPRLLKLRRSLANQLIDWSPDLFIGIDAPEFNLDLELILKKADIKTVHYVSPSVWAWREKRIFKIKQAVDYMLTLFTFETDIYQQHNIPVACVGHPLANMIDFESDMNSARQVLNLSAEDKIVALLPGSRGSEIKYLGQLFLETALRLQKAKPELKFVVPLVNERRQSQFMSIKQTVAPDLDVTIVIGRSREVMAAADTILLASGTATFEAMLLKKPMVVAYKVSALSYAIYRRLMKIDKFSLPNLLSDIAQVPEFIQDDATVEAIAAEVTQQLETGLSAEQAAEYLRIHQSLRLGAGEMAVSQLTEHFSLSS